MPYRNLIAAIDERIEEVKASVAQQRTTLAQLPNRKAARREAESKLETLLATFARLRAERLQLVARQKLDWD